MDRCEKKTHTESKIQTNDIFSQLFRFNCTNIFMRKFYFMLENSKTSTVKCEMKHEVFFMVRANKLRKEDEKDKTKIKNKNIN